MVVVRLVRVRMIVGVILEEMMNSGKKEKPVLASLSDLYLELEIISVGVSEPFSCSTLHCLLTTALRKIYMILI